MPRKQTQKKNIITSARNIRAVLSDVDGVFTNNQILEGAPYKAKLRSYYDGQGVSLLRALGIHVCLLTNEKGVRSKSVVDMVNKWNKLPSSQKGHWKPVKLYRGVGGHDKVKKAQEWLQTIGVDFDECAYMGDELLDVPMLRKVSLTAAPAQAEIVIRNIVDFVSERNGGEGAFRDFVNFIVDAKGVDPLDLDFQ